MIFKCSGADDWFRCVVLGSVGECVCTGHQSRNKEGGEVMASVLLLLPLHAHRQPASCSPNPPVGSTGRDSISVMNKRWESKRDERERAGGWRCAACLLEGRRLEGRLEN